MNVLHPHAASCLHPLRDAHFFTISVADTEAGGSNDMTSCETTHVPIQCDPGSADPRNVAFLLQPQAEYVPEAFSLDFQFGGHSIINHGAFALTSVLSNIPASHVCTVCHLAAVRAPMGGAHPP